MGDVHPTHDKSHGAAGRAPSRVRSISPPRRRPHPPPPPTHAHAPCTAAVASSCVVGRLARPPPPPRLDGDHQRVGLGRDCDCRRHVRVQRLGLQQLRRRQPRCVRRVLVQLPACHWRGVQRSLSAASCLICVVTKAAASSRARTVAPARSRSSRRSSVSLSRRAAPSRVERLSAKALYKSNRVARPHVAAQRCGAGVGRVGGLCGLGLGGHGRQSWSL